MFTKDDLRALVSRPEHVDKTVLTIYLDVDQSKQSNQNRGFEKTLKHMLFEVRSAIRDGSELKRFEIASRHVQDIVARYKTGAQGLAIVFDASDKFLQAFETGFPIRNEIRWAREAFAGPLAAALDEYEHVGIVLVDRARLRLFTMFLGEVEEQAQEEFNHRQVRHTKTVGMDHIGSASHAQRRADEQIRLNLRHASKTMQSMLERNRIRRIILAGSADVTAELRTILPKRLLPLIIGTVDLAITAPVGEIRNAASLVAERFERENESALVTDLVTSGAKSRRVVLGLRHTLHALNQGRVWQLVYSDGFHSRGYQCPKCAALFSIETTSCSYCGYGVVPIDDVVERAVDHTVRNGAKLEVVRDGRAESALMNAGGIGAFLRTRTASALVP